MPIIASPPGLSHETVISPQAAESDGVVLSSGVLEKMERELQHVVEMASELS